MKIVLKIVTNLLVCVVIFFVLDFASYLTFFIAKKEITSVHRLLNIKYSPKLKSFDAFYSEVKADYFRPPSGLNYKKKSIIIFGCSYAYGYVFPDDQSFSYKLSQYIHRPVYNRAYLGWGIQHMLYQLQRNDFYKEVDEPLYVIFVMMGDHPRRMYLDVFDVFDVYNIEYPAYYLDNNLLKKRKSLGYESAIQKNYNYRHVADFIWNEKNHDKVFYLMKALFIQSNELVKQHYPDAKFIIVKFPDDDSNWYMKTNRWKELEEKGIQVADLNALTGKDLSSSEYVYVPGVDFHPLPKVWDLVIPKLVEKLEL